MEIALATARLAGFHRALRGTQGTARTWLLFLRLPSFSFSRKDCPKAIRARENRRVVIIYLHYLDTCKKTGCLPKTRPCRTRGSAALAPKALGGADREHPARRATQVRGKERNQPQRPTEAPAAQPQPQVNGDAGPAGPAGPRRGSPPQGRPEGAGPFPARAPGSRQAEARPQRGSPRPPAPAPARPLPPAPTAGAGTASGRPRASPSRRLLTGSPAGRGRTPA